MKALYRLLVRVSDTIFKVEKWLLLAAVVAVTLVNFLNVILRYLLNSGLAYCEMLSIVLFMFMVIIGGNIAVKSDSEIRIDMLTSRDPKKRALFRFVSDVISIAALVLGIAGLFATIGATTKNLQRVTPLPIYTYHIYIAMTVGFFLMLLDHVIVFAEHLLTIAGIKTEGGVSAE